MLGGFVASAVGPGGHVVAVALPWPPDLRVVVATPAATLETSVARRALPREEPLPDAVANVQRVALLVQALAAGDRRALREAFRDRLHQPYRLPVVPGLAAALAFEHPDPRTALPAPAIAPARRSLGSSSMADSLTLLERLSCPSTGVDAARQSTAFS